MSRFLSSIVLFIAIAILLLPAENRSQNLIPGERHHVILCFDANGNQGKIDLTSKSGQEKFREALDSLFVRLQQPESGAETRPIFAPSQHDLATIVYYVPDARGAGKIGDFDFTRDFVFLPPAGSMVAQENLPAVDTFIPSYTEILRNNRRGDALTLYQEAAAAGILKLAETQFTEALKPVDKIYLINFYAENINLSSAYNTLDAFIRKTWPDTTDSPGATTKRDNLVGQLAAIKSRLTEIHRNTIAHIYGFRLHYTVAKYNPTPVDAANFLQDPLQDFSFHTAGGDNIDAELDLKRCLLASRLEQLQPEFWTLLIFGGQAGGDTLAQNFGYVSESYVARVRASFSRLNAVPKDSLRARTQITAYATEPLALKARLKSNALDLKIALPSWLSRNSGWVIPLIVIALFAAGFYIAKVVMARKERRPKVDLALKSVLAASSKVRIDLDHNTPGWRTVANLKLINATRYNQYQKNIHSRYPIESGEITVTYKAFCGDQPIEFVLSEEKPLVGVEVSKSGQQFLQTRHESLAIPIREEDEIGSAQPTGTTTLSVSLQPELIADVKNCLKLDREVDAELHITATCTGADGNSPVSDTCIVPLQFVRQSARLEIQTQAVQKEISYDDSTLQPVCDFHFAIPAAAKEFSMPISGNFILSKADYVVKEKFPFELFYQDNPIEKFELHKLQRGQIRTLSVYVNFGRESITAPHEEGEKRTLRLLLEPSPPSEGIGVAQREELENVGREYVFYVTPDKRKPHIGIEIAKIRQDYFKASEEGPSTVFKDDVYNVIAEKTTTLRPVLIEFDPTEMDLQEGLYRDAVADFIIHSHRCRPHIGEIKQVRIEFEKSVHAEFLEVEIGDGHENVLAQLAKGNGKHYVLASAAIPTGEKQATTLHFYIDWAGFRNALRAKKLAPIYPIRPSETVQHEFYPKAEVIEFDGKPYEFIIKFILEINASGKAVSLQWEVDWKIILSPTKNQFWISLDYGTSAIAAACLGGRNAYEDIFSLPLQEKWVSYQEFKVDRNTIDKFLTSRMRVMTSGSDARLGQAGFVEFIHPSYVDPREGNVLPPLKTMITEPHVNLLKPIEFVDQDGNLENGRPQTELVLRSMYAHLFQKYILPCLQEHLVETVYKPRMKKLSNKNDACFVSIKEYLARFVITVPNSFIYWHVEKLHRQLEDIARDVTTPLPGERTKFVFLSESEAVAYYYIMMERRKARPRISSPKPLASGARDEYILIYDQGAGTLDLSYIRLSDIFGRGETKTNKVEILSQVGAYAAGNNINYALAEIIENGVKTRELTPANGELQFKGERSLLPVCDNQTKRELRFKESSRDFTEALISFQLDLDNKYKRNITHLGQFEVDLRQHDPIFEHSNGSFKVDADYVRAKFYQPDSDANIQSMYRLAHRMTNGILDSLFKLSLLPQEQRQPGKVPLDRVIFSGRSIAFLGVQEYGVEAIKKWTAKDVDPYPLDTHEEAKIAVAKGALYYATDVLRKAHTDKAERFPIFVRYVVRDSVDGRPVFRELLSPHTVSDGRVELSNKFKISLVHDREVILYETKREIAELNAMTDEEQAKHVVEVCRIPGGDMSEVEVALTVLRESGKLIFTANGREPAQEHICPPPRNEPGYEEGQWPYIFMTE